jgi:hypothetical protein
MNYKTEPQGWEYPHTIKLPSEKELVYMFPIYNFTNISKIDIVNEATIPSLIIDSISIPISDMPCVDGIYSVNPINHFSLLPTLTLQTGWENKKLYQSFN